MSLLLQLLPPLFAFLWNKTALTGCLYFLSSPLILSHSHSVQAFPQYSSELAFVQSPGPPCCEIQWSVLSSHLTWPMNSIWQLIRLPASNIFFPCFLDTTLAWFSCYLVDLSLTISFPGAPSFSYRCSSSIGSGVVLFRSGPPLIS